MISSNSKANVEQNGRLILFHRTTTENTRSIIEGGFMNSAGYYGNNRTWTGVWLSTRPLANADDAEGDTLLVVKLEISEQQLSRWEWTAEGRSYRQWLIPAHLINSCMTVERADQMDHIHNAREPRLPAGLLH